MKAIQIAALSLSIATSLNVALAQDESNDPSYATALYQGLDADINTGEPRMDAVQKLHAHYAFGYTMGVADTLRGIYWCPPHGTTRLQTELIVLNYMKAHPDKWQSASPALISEALREAYPCKSAQNAPAPKG